MEFQLSLLSPLLLVTLMIMIILNPSDSFRMPSAMLCNQDIQHKYGGSSLTRCCSSIVTNMLTLTSSEEIPHMKNTLYELVDRCQPNGINALASVRMEISSIVEELERRNPTERPALSNRMNGFWRMHYTDFSPPATSSGKLGPLIGEVYQDLYPTNQTSSSGVIKNILRITFPPIVGALVAKQRIVADDTWSIEFQCLSNKIAGFIRLPISTFPPGSQIRLWQIIYLDDDLRIMRAGRLPLRRDESFIFIFRRLADSDRIVVNIWIWGRGGGGEAQSNLIQRLDHDTCWWMMMRIMII